MKAPNGKMLEKALAMHLEGAKLKAILEATKLNYSQAWYYIRSHELRQAGLLEKGTITGKRVVELRGEDHSWGEIAVRCQMAESKIRRMYTEATELKSQGQRIGKGGRFYYGPVDGYPLYEDVLKPTGTQIPKGAPRAVALEAAGDQKLIHQDVQEIAKQATALGISLKAGKRSKTKAQLVTQILKARKAELVSA